MDYIFTTLGNLISQSAFATMTWGNVIMIAVACVFLYLAIVKGYEPLLLVPISFGMLLVNIYPPIMEEGGLLNYFFKLDEWAILPCLIFLGVGAQTDFGPLIANPASFLLGAAAQFGIFAAFFGAMLLGFNEMASAAIAIIGGADGPTSIYLANKLGQQDILGPIAVAAYYEGSYDAGGAEDQNGTAATGQQDGEDSLPYHCYHCCLHHSAFYHTPGRYAHVRQPV
jgi:oxaloacetate decarboxylase beta subunit